MTHSSPPKLIILTCMRSYSSLISGMLGQHSGMYTLPEINPFVGDSVEEMIAVFKLVRPRSLDGLYRMVAELEYGRQNYDTINQARAFLDEHGTWTPAQLLDYAAAKVAPKIIIEKSPSTSVVAHAIQRALHFCPQAYFLHLYRHPVATTASIARITDFGKAKGLRRSLVKDPELSWYATNTAILDAARQIPPGQFISVRGEDILTDPDRYFRQIGAWLGLRTTARDLDEMRHPERSPYARFGPVNAPYGADPNYLENPAFSQRAIVMAPLDAPLSWDVPTRRLLPESITLSMQLGYGTSLNPSTAQGSTS